MDYRPILPSSLLEVDFKGDDPALDAFLKNFSDFSLKTGIILKSYPVEDDDNISKTTTEYDVLAFVQDKDLGSAAVIYKRCITLDLFGGIADFFEFTRRSPTKDPLKSKEPILEDGALVVFLCANGNSDKGIIIGGLRHPKRKLKINKESETHLEGEFNGIHIQINKDGEFELTFKGATDNKGKVIGDEKASGTYFKILKSGNFEIGSGNKEKILIDKENKLINLEAEKKISLKTIDEDISLESEKKNISFKSKKDFIVDAEGSALFNTKQEIKLISKNKWVADGAQIEIKGKSQIKLASSIIQIEGSIVQLGQGSKTPAVTSQTKFIGTGYAGTPVISSAMGPFSTSVYIGS